MNAGTRSRSAVLLLAFVVACGGDGVASRPTQASVATTASAPPPSSRPSSSSRPPPPSSAPVTEPPATSSLATMAPSSPPPGAPLDRSGTLISAFFGLDDALPPMAAALCAEAPGRDGLVVNVTDRLDPDRVVPSDWVVVTASGRRLTPTCASLAPAFDPGELRTVLLIGDLGDAASDPPVAVEVPNGLPMLDPAAAARAPGATVRVVPLADGPTIVAAEVVAGSTNGTEMRTDINGCPAGTVQTVRVFWAGGVTSIERPDQPAADADRYRVGVVAVGATTTVTPSGLADLGDGDNVHELCLTTDAVVQRVDVAAGVFSDPNGDPNPDTGIAVTSNDDG